MEKYIALGREDLPDSYALIEIPVVARRRSDQDWDRSQMRRAHYFIEYQDRYELNKGRPYAVGMIGYRSASHPDHFDVSFFHSYATMEEARERSQLATWFYVLGDRQAEEIAFAQDAICCDLRTLTLIEQARALAVNAEETHLRSSLSVTASNDESLAPMPSPEQLNRVIASGGDWRRQWVFDLPADPLQLLVRADRGGAFPTVDWFATIRRVAATVATRTSKATICSQVSGAYQLLRRFALPIPAAAFDIVFEILVQLGEARFAGDESGHPNRWCVVWCADPQQYAAYVPRCPCCGEPRVLGGACSGLTYGDWRDEGPSRFMDCPFDRYGCLGGPNQFVCCHCAAIAHQIYERKQSGRPMPVEEIDGLIASHRAAIEQAGGTPFPSRRQKR